MPSKMVLKIRGYHIDANGHVNHARFVRFMEEARWDYFDQHPGLTRTFAAHGITHATVHLRIDYHHPVVVGEKLRIVTTVILKSSRSITFGQKIYLDDSGRLSAEAVVVNVYFVGNSQEPMETRHPIFSAWEDLCNAPLENNRRQTP